MSLVVTGASGEEANSNDATLKEMLSNANVPDSVYTKLNESGMNDFETLLFSDDNDLEELCKELQFNLKEKMKFKAAIRKFKNVNKQKQQANVIHISSEEHKDINKIKIALKNCDNIINMLYKHDDEIDNNAQTVESKMNATFENIIKSLQDRQKTMTRKIAEWKALKHENINKSILNINEYNKKLQLIMEEINDSLKADDLMLTDNREKTIKQITMKLFGDDYKKYKQYQNVKKYINENTKLIDVEFQDEISMNKLKSFGTINVNLKNDLFNIPSITLAKPIKTEENADRYKIKLKWKMITKETKQDFTIKYIKSNDDEKKVEINDKKPEEWMIISDHKKIQYLEDNNYSAAISDQFLFDEMYKFKVSSTINSPIMTNIESNINSLIIEGKVDVSQEEAITLKIHSHHGHYNDNVPENTLKSDNTWYYSTMYYNSNDWIIYQANNNHDFYIPTKIEIRSDGSNGNTVKQFTLSIGNESNTEWLVCQESSNQNTFSLARQLSTMQTFTFLDLLNNKAKIHKIKRNGWNQFKLNMLNNHAGSNCIAFQEIKVFGVKYNLFQ